MNTYKPRGAGNASKPSFGNKGRSGGDRFAGSSSRPRFGSGGGNGGGSRGRFNSRPKNGGGNRSQRGGIDHNLFINKAKEEVVEAYVPTHGFTDFGLDVRIVENLTRKGYKTPSPIQDQSIPVVLGGRDMIGIANTGTGKTAAFLLPLIHKLAEDKNKKVMVLTPTRELAQQIEAELRAFTFGMKIFSISCVGGMPIRRQMMELERGVSFVIGTPGRVKDLITRGKIKMKDYGYIVLDEADRMLDMGFIDDMREILSAMLPTKQALFFSATMPPAIRTLCAQFLKDPVNISVKTRDTASNVDQDVVRIRNKGERIEVLHELLSGDDFTKVLIFREMKRQVDELEEELSKRGFKALALHGDMRNRERAHAVKSLATGTVQVVIATDVAARGIDIPDISHVINYDIPRDYETYVHRIGRTGRGSSKGKSLTFI